ncbi:hypothetical protein HZB96_01455 [Candidatus Gottesmanbacteria bacterium]|nr:hypothetical protein [Candidatus Gottesmanbacteria bacterium]
MTEGLTPILTQGAVLGETTNSTTGSAKEAPIKNQGGTSLPLLFLLIIGGIGCIVGAVILSTKQIRRRVSYKS